VYANVPASHSISASTWPTPHRYPADKHENGHTRQALFQGVFDRIRAARRLNPTASQKPGTDRKTFISNVDIVKIMKKAQGFTLVELMMTLLVAGILLVVAVPAFNDIIQDNRATAANNSFINALAVARSEAIRSRATISICSSTDQASCAASASWETGWIIFNDDDSDGVVDAAAVPPEVVLRAWPVLAAGFSLTAAGGNSNIQFDRLGAASSNETFNLSNPGCKSGQRRDRQITLTGAGTARFTATNCP